jgi:anthranilate phosphoribosyltransferase
MKHVAPIRKELEFRSIFNVLGPLTNPAGTKRQLIGTFNEQTSKLMSDAIKYLDMKKVCFVCTDNKYDEISLTHPANVIETMENDGMYFYKLTHEAFNFPKVELAQIQGGSAKENAEIIHKIFSGKEKSAPYYVVAANAALALKAAGVSTNLDDCVNRAEESILSGATHKKLNELKEFGDKNK